MCNRTPKPGETWVFRRDSYRAPVYNDAGEVVVEGSRQDYQLVSGEVDLCGRDGVALTAGAERNIAWRDGWEPFLCLDEGETQEHPTVRRACAKCFHPAMIGGDLCKNHANAVRIEPRPPKPEVGERWEFCKDGQDRLWTGTVEGVGKRWVVITGPILLDTDVVKPVRKLAS